MRLLCVILIIILIISSIYGSDSRLEDSEKWYQNARYFFENRKDFVSAVEACTHSLSLDPQNHKARELLQKSREALGLALVISSFDRENSLRWYQKGNYLYSIKKSEDQIIDALQKSLIYDPENHYALSLLNKIRQEKKYSLEDEKNRAEARDNLLKANKSLSEGDFNSAILFYEKVIRSDPNSFDSYIKLIHLYEYYEKWDEIKIIFDKIFNFFEFGYAGEKMKEVLISETECLENRKKLEKALLEHVFSIETMKYFIDEKSVKSLDSVPPILLQYRSELNRMNVLDQKELIEKGHLIEPIKCPSGGDLYLFGENRIRCTFHCVENDRDILRTKKEYPSDNTFESYVNRNITDEEKRNKEQVIARQIIIEEYIEAKNIESAYNECIDLLKIESNNMFALKKASELSYLLEKFEESIEHSEKIITNYPSEAEGYFRYALASLKKSREKDFLSGIEKSIVINPSYIEAYLNRAIYFYHKKDYDKALADFNFVYEKEKDNHRVLFYSALIYFHFKRYEDSRNNFDKLLRILKPGTPLYNRSVDLKKRLDRIFPSPKQKSKYELPRN